MPSAFLWDCRRLNVALTPYVLIVSVPEQRVGLFRLQPRPWWQQPHAHCLRCYRASTSRFGTGQQLGSNRTPLGLHRIREKIGAGQPVGTVFESRRAVGLTWNGYPEAAIAHRILWLDGLEPGFNQGGEVDSHARYIYIHGLANEPTLGKPASRGCVHLSAADLLPLFDLVPPGTLVWIA